MLIVLPVLSFICAGLLAVFIIILAQRPSVSVATVSLVLWLLLGNAIHAVNALVWSSNVQERIPIWCDIVTKLLLGATAALPGACLCTARHLELLASSRKLYPNTYSKRLHTLADVALCYVLPLLYMILHFAVQDHRFDLVQDFGCSASIHRSTPAVLLMVLPPLIMCSISLVLCLVSLYHCTRLPPSRFAAHLAARTSSSSSASSRSTTTTPRFTRALAQAITLTTAVLIATLFPLFALSPQTASQTQTQTAFPHNADLSDIFVIRNARDVAGAQLVWWAVPVVSIVYIILVLVLGLGDDDSARWDLLSWVAGRVRRPTQRPARPELKLLTINHALAMGSKSPSSSSSSSAPSPAAPHAVQLPLRSGWDDMLDVKKNRLPFGRKSVLSSASSDSSDDTLGTSSPISPKEKEEEEEEEAFTHSTLTYLASPVAQALGLLSPSPSPSPSPIPSPSPSACAVAPPAATYHAAASASPPRHRDRPRPLALAPPSASVTPPPKPTPTPTPTPTPARTLSTHTHLRPPQQPIPEDTASTISSIWDAPWPLPPPSPRGLRPPAYPMHSPVAPVGMGLPPGVPLKSALKKGKGGGERTWSREALARGYAGVDVIYMTAVHASA